MTTLTTPDSLAIWTGSDPQSLAAASAAMMTSVQAALAKREVHSFKWANSAERGSQTGMTEGDLGDQLDTDTLYRYDGAKWQTLISPSITYPVGLQGVNAVGNGVITGQYSLLGKMVIVEGSLRVGSTTTFNTSNFAVILPVDAAPKYEAVAGFESVVGSCGILNPGVIAFSGPVVIRQDNANYANLKFQAIFNGQIVDALAKQSNPVALGSGDLITWSFTYQSST